MHAAARIQPATTPEEVPQPTVSFDGDQINIAVIVTPGSEPDQLAITAAPVLVPKGTWTMLFDLQTAEGATAVFTSVQLPENPLPSRNVTISGSGPVSGSNGTQWSAVIDNQVTSFNGFNYTICVAPSSSGPSTCKDPAIAVTSDPITG